jgi:sialic acid synthase
MIGATRKHGHNKDIAMNPYLVAEIGCNHCGDLDIARKLIRTAAVFCEVPCVKFQKRTPREMLSPAEFDGPHPDPRNAYGPTYGAHRDFLELSLDQHRLLRDCCTENNIAYACSVWDLTSAREIASLGPRFVKIPSACNTWFALADAVCDTFPGEIHVALGMTTPREIDAIVAHYQQRNRAGDLILYHCTSGYPVDFEDLHLLEIARLRDTYGASVKAIGFSGHHRGIAVDIAALTLGATYFERHFTLDRTWKGTDHAASLEPDGLRRLGRDLHAAAAALTPKPKDILDVEEPQRRKLKWDRNAS